MKADKISESGTIGKDGKLRLPMDRINQFTADNKGMRVIATFEVVEPGSTVAQQSYFYSYILPTCQQAFKELGNRYSLGTLEILLLSEYGSNLTSVRNLDKSRMSDFIDWLKQYAAENLNVYIEDARTI